MKILFVHQNFPGQFKHLAPALVAMGHEVVALAMKAKAVESCGVTLLHYAVTRGSSPDIHPWVGDLESKAIRAEASFHAARQLRDQGFSPDVIIAHAGWGESLFLKDVWPRAKLGIYCEFFYHAKGTDVDFDPEFHSPDDSDACRIRLKNINNMLHFNIADAGIAPTRWQADTFPQSFRGRIAVVHDGIDTAVIAPNPHVRLTLGGGLSLTRSDEVITFVNRNLEPCRGYHIFMRALPEILRRRPRARVLIVGGSGVSYGPRPAGGGGWRDVFADEVRGRIAAADWDRVHFLGKIAYDHFIPLLQLSTVHVYLTYPFVLSWSLLEAMSVGCAIVASDTGPLREVMRHDDTGRLVDFFDVAGLADEVCTLLDDPERRTRLGAAARGFAQANYDLRRVCLPRQVQWVQTMAEGPGGGSGHWNQPSSP